MGVWARNSKFSGFHCRVSEKKIGEINLFLLENIYLCVYVRPGLYYDLLSNKSEWSIAGALNGQFSLYRSWPCIKIGQNFASSPMVLSLRVQLHRTTSRDVDKKQKGTDELTQSETQSEVPTVALAKNACHLQVRGIYSSIIRREGGWGIKPVHLAKNGEENWCTRYFSRLQTKMGNILHFR